MHSFPRQFYRLSKTLWTLIRCNTVSLISSSRARKKNLDVSLMERLAKEFSNTNINQLLTVQYRMNEKIMQWSSREFYESRLVADESVAKITLRYTSSFYD